MSRTAPTAALSLVHKIGKKAQQNDRIYEEMFTAILEQRLAPGTKLSEDTLGEIFGVSRTIVRTVLQRLAHERIVRIHPNRGAFVSEPTPDEAREVLQARRLIEEGVMRLAVARRTVTDVKNLRAMVGQEQESLDKGAHETWVRQSGDFHLKLAAIAGNQTLAAYIKELVSRTSLIIVQYQKGSSSSCSCDEHTDIIDAIEAQDEDKAVDLMLRHLQACEEQLNLKTEDAATDLYAVFSKISGK
ncbi:MAG: GntR family transcriptional regulator [Sneathiella sp.]|nr:MAG: GntR family transcriptional regulator [Sneathiella sp.]